MLTKEEEEKLTSSIMTMFADVSMIKNSIVRGEKDSEKKILFIKSFLRFYSHIKKSNLNEEIKFDFIGNGVTTVTTDEVVDENKNYNNEVDENQDTDSEYQFSQADEEETKEVNKKMAYSAIMLRKARDSRGFVVNKIIKKSFDTDLVSFV